MRRPEYSRYRKCLGTLKNLLHGWKSGFKEQLSQNTLKDLDC